MPATITEFLGEEYLDLEKTKTHRRYIRRRLKKELIKIFGKKVNTYRVAQVSEACLSGSIGWGKTFGTSIAMLYMIHWLKCLKDPQEFLGLAPGSMIAVMLMATKKEQAEDVIFKEIKARLQQSWWFGEFAPWNAEKDTKRMSKRLSFGGNIYIIPGDSLETTFEGYNIIGGVLDEGDSHKTTRDKCYADIGYTTIKNRMKSRFEPDFSTMPKELRNKEIESRGLIIALGQAKVANGFMERKLKAVKANPDGYAVRIPIWEAKDKETYSGRTFLFDPERLTVVPKRYPGVMTIPVEYQKEFIKNPQKALKDLAGRPTRPGMPWLVDTSKLQNAFARWRTNHSGEKPPVDESGVIEDTFWAHDHLPRIVHFDLARKHDAAGFGMGHISRIIPDKEAGEDLFYITMDMLMRVTAPPGGEIQIAGMRRLVYLMQDRGFNIIKATFDGFASDESIQQLNNKGIVSEVLSVDKTLGPYMSLHEAIVGDRFEVPPLLCKLDIEGEEELVNIVDKEARELKYVDTGTAALKIDHPENGSKDVMDPCAGVVHGLLNTSAAQYGTIDFDFRVAGERTLSRVRRQYASRR